MSEHEHSDWTTTVEEDPRHEGIWIQTDTCNVCGVVYIYRTQEPPPGYEEE